MHTQADMHTQACARTHTHIHTHTLAHTQVHSHPGMSHEEYARSLLLASVQRLLPQPHLAPLACLHARAPLAHLGAVVIRGCAQLIVFFTHVHAQGLQEHGSANTPQRPERNNGRSNRGSSPPKGPSLQGASLGAGGAGRGVTPGVQPVEDQGAASRQAPWGEADRACSAKAAMQDKGCAPSEQETAGGYLPGPEARSSTDSAFGLGAPPRFSNDSCSRGGQGRLQPEQQQRRQQQQQQQQQAPGSESTAGAAAAGAAQQEIQRLVHSFLPPPTTGSPRALPDVDWYAQGEAHMLSFRAGAQLPAAPPRKSLPPRPCGPPARSGSSSSSSSASSSSASNPARAAHRARAALAEQLAICSSPTPALPAAEAPTAPQASLPHLVPVTGPSSIQIGMIQVGCLVGCQSGCRRMALRGS